MEPEETPEEVTEEALAEEVQQDPIARLQAILGELDPSALVVGFATVIEWLEEDGSRALSLVGTEMDPWHAFGLLTYGRQQLATVGPIEVYEFEGEGDEDDF